MKARSFLNAGIGILSAAIVGATVLPSVGILVNHTASMPVGVWLLHRGATVYRPGDIVVACPPLTEREAVYFEPGTCPTGFQPVVKPIVAVAGDQVTVVPDGLGIIINGTYVPNSWPLTADAAGRPLLSYPAGTYTVGSGELWLLSPVIGSFDSRYLGPIPTSVIRGTATPLWVRH